MHVFPKTCMTDQSIYLREEMSLDVLVETSSVDAHDDKGVRQEMIRDFVVAHVFEA